jgi:hypothetical protein
MSCASEAYAALVGAHPSLCLLDYSGDAVESRVRQREIHRARALAPDGSSLTASRLVPDSSKTDPEYVWGDEGPISE